MSLIMFLLVRVAPSSPRPPLSLVQLTLQQKFGVLCRHGRDRTSGEALVGHVHEVSSRAPLRRIVPVGVSETST